MSQNRKLKASIEGTLKKIEELITEFEEIWERVDVYTADSQPQKEKYEGDLKKQIKKLQRQRDCLKSWSQSTDPLVAQYGDRLADAKREIEERMAKFRECEKETKTKAFSKEGLKQPYKQSPTDEKREEILDQFRRQISELKKEIDESECEEKKEKSRKRNASQSIVTKLEFYIKNHHWHVGNLELVLRQLHNHILDPYDMEDIITGVDDYLSKYKEPDFFFDDTLYDDLDLNTNPPADDDFSDFSDDSSDAMSSTVGDLLTDIITDTDKAPPTPIVRPALPIIPSLATLTAATKPKQPPAKPLMGVKPINYSEIIQRSLKPTSASQSPASATAVKQSPTLIRASSTPLSPPTLTSPHLVAKALLPVMIPVAPQPLSAVSSQTSPQTPLRCPSVPAAASTEVGRESAFVRSLRSRSRSPALASPRCIAPLWTRYELMDSVLQAIDRPVRSLDDVVREEIYRPVTPVAVPDFFPQVPLRNLDEDVWKVMPTDVAFFAFGYKQNTYQQYAAARLLKHNNWRYHKKNRTWYFRTSAKHISEDGETCDMNYFDYTKWQVQAQPNMEFSYQYLEDEYLP